MARIQEEIILIRLSKILRNNDDGVDHSFIDDETLSSLEQVAQELVGEDVIVEIERTPT